MLSQHDLSSSGPLLLHGPKMTLPLPLLQGGFTGDKFLPDILASLCHHSTLTSIDTRLFHSTDPLQENGSAPLVSSGGRYTHYESTR